MNKRFEIKFIVPCSEAKEIIKKLQAFWGAARDEHSQRGPYTIQSVYFDDPSVTSYWNHVDGAHTREKVRLRWYPRTWPDRRLVLCPPYFLEIKKRHGYLNSKERLEINEVSESNIERLPIFFAEKLPQLYGRLLRPTVLVSYLRQAFVLKAEKALLRVTFDTLLQRVGLNEHPQRERWANILSPTETVIELKIVNLNDYVFREICSIIGSHRQAVSKYVGAMTFSGGH